MNTHLSEKIQELTNLKEDQKRVGIFVACAFLYAIVGPFIGLLVKETGDITFFLVYMLPITVVAIFVNVYPHPNTIRKMTLSLYNLLEKSKTNMETINEILVLSTKLYQDIKKFTFIKRWNFFMNKSNTERLENLITLVNGIIYDILTNLRSDLQLRLTEQQKTLEQAKSEVEQNIHGTTELNQVSELQKARLDRQIGQFEKLQKVLVKV